MRRLLRGAAVAATCLALAACGSQLQPEAVMGVTSNGAPGTSVDGTGTAVAAGPLDQGATAAGPGPAGTADGSAPVAGADSGGAAAGDGASGGREAGGDAGGTEAAPPAGDQSRRSCAGFENGPGITDETVTIGNASDISGPVPGLFEAAQQAVAAYVAFFNASGATICGRRLEMVPYDSRTDAAADQQAYTRGCDEVFAMVGAMSAFDSGGVGAAEECGLPDVRAISTTPERTACRVCYAAQPAGPEEFQNAVPDFIKRHHDGGQKAAMLFVNAGAASVNGMSQVRFSTKRGMKYVYVKDIDVAEFNYAPYVQGMKDAGVETVQFVAAGPQFVRLAQAMRQQGFEPELYLLDPTAYSPEYTEAAGETAEGTVSYLNFAPFEEADRNPELSSYLTWLQQVSPGATPDFFGVFAWSAARLFVEQASRLGGELSRRSLIASMAEVDRWTANDLHAPQAVAAKRITDCWRFVQWSGSRWDAVEGGRYQCRGTTS